jgi:acetyl esterase/lipase
VKRPSKLILAVLILITTSCGQQQEKELKGDSQRVYGPRIIPIDYDSLYQLKEPPDYQPLAMYGSFLFGVANQQISMVYDTKYQLPENIKKYKDVIYKESKNLTLALDVYMDKFDKSPNPLILIIHGGYWKAGDKGAFYTQRAMEFVELGYTVASINYRLSTEHKFPANIEDLRDGILFLTEHAKEFNIDPSQIMTYGISAGGHLAAFVVLSANSDRGYVKGLNPSVFKGAISMYGIHDMSLTIQREHPFNELYIGTSYTLDTTNYIDASTTQHVDVNDPPILLIHGTLDGSVSVKNSDNLAKVLESKKVPYVYDRIEGWPHVMDFFSPIGERSLWQIHKFLEDHMPSEEIKNKE